MADKTFQKTRLIAFQDKIRMSEVLKDCEKSGTGLSYIIKCCSLIQ